MADEIDRATDQWEIISAALIQNAGAFHVEFPVTGFCLNCQEPLAEGLRWCDKDCKDDHAKRTRR